MTRTTIRNASAIGSALVFIAAACGGDEAPAIVESGVGVVAAGCPGPATESGSGVVVGTPGLVVTVAHTVAGATSITVIDNDDEEFDATVVAFDQDADLALLDVSGLDAPALSIGSAALGAATAIVWSPDAGVTEQPAEIAKRLLITIEDIYLEDETQRSGFEFVADIDSGDSGGAVVDTQGDVVGVIYAKSLARPGTAFATNDIEIRRLLDERPLDPTDRCT